MRSGGFWMDGQRIFNFKSKNCEMAIWNPLQSNPELAKGLYLIKLRQGEKSTIEKVIYSE